ncbi:hypothetical protein [Methylobacterium sp. Leaf123]|uniref:hypothetical protein n=1 Tax=Methylobacterium sp. Leaf123 TaxID=1736264 RepID=UPI0012E91871|nr:hypothetical protein [Methylobacterium sp. Leaf123]
MADPSMSTDVAALNLAVSRDSDRPLIRCGLEKLESAPLTLVGDVEGRMIQDATPILRVEARAPDG